MKKEKISPIRSNMSLLDYMDDQIELIEILDKQHRIIQKTYKRKKYLEKEMTPKRNELIQDIKNYEKDILSLKWVNSTHEYVLDFFREIIRYKDSNNYKIKSNNNFNNLINIYGITPIIRRGFNLESNLNK